MENPSLEEIFGSRAVVIGSVFVIGTDGIKKTIGRAKHYPIAYGNGRDA
jgi:hypothetical protein